MNVLHSGSWKQTNQQSGEAQTQCGWQGNRGDRRRRLTRSRCNKSQRGRKVEKEGKMKGRWSSRGEKRERPKIAIDRGLSHSLFVSLLHLLKHLLGILWFDRCSTSCRFGGGCDVGSTCDWTAQKQPLRCLQSSLAFKETRVDDEGTFCHYYSMFVSLFSRLPHLHLNREE